MRYIILLTLLLFCFNSYATDIEDLSQTMGVKTLLVEEDSLPIVSLEMIFQNSGSAYDPENKQGLAYLTAGLLDEGAGKYDALAYKKKLEELAILLSFDTDKDSLRIGLKTLRSNLTQAIEILKIALMEPHIAPEAIAREKSQAIVAIQNDEEDPQTLASMAWNKLAYGNHPYAQPVKGSVKSISNITKDDVLNFLNRNIRKSNLIISIVGDVDQKDVVKFLTPFISPLQEDHVPSQKVSYVKDLPYGEEYFLSKPNPQSSIIFGLKGLSYKDPNFYPLYILNHIIGGGGFESRLVKKIREENGLAYSTYSYLTIARNSALIKGYIGTKNESRQQALDLLHEILNDIKENGVNEEELNAAKSYLIGSYPLRMDSNSKLASGLSFIQYEALGLDFMEKRNDYVASVTLEQVNNIARKLINPDDTIIAIVGEK